MSTSPLDALVAALAERQHGVVERDQLRGIGLTERMIASRIRRGWLHRIHRGVYAVGHKRLTKEGRYMAAVLACGEGAALARQTAAAHWAIRPYSGRITVTTPGRPRRRKGTPFVASSSCLEDDEVTTHAGIPTTTVARTILDLAGILKPDTLEKVIREAEFLRLFDLDELERLLARHPNAKGSADLRASVERAAESRNRTRSDLEDRFFELMRRAKVPLPEINHVIALPDEKFEVDIAWPDNKLIVELDGWQGHGTRSAFERDRERDLALKVAEWDVVRITWRMLAGGLPPDLVRLLSQ